MFLENLFLYIVAFFLIWIGSGLIVTSVSKFSEKLRLSPFAFSFIFLGLMTSIPEFSIGLQAVASNDAGIFVGNLLGGTLVIFLFIIPMLAIFGNGIHLKNELDNKTLLMALFIALAPAIFVLDSKITNLEGAFLILLYLVLIFLVERKNGIFNRNNARVFNVKNYSVFDLAKIIVGIGLVLIASSLIVSKTIYFAEIFNIPAFYISLIIIAIGTNLPELSLAVRSVVLGKKEVAMGDYMGSVAANSFLFGVFTILYAGETLAVDSFMTTFIFIFISLCILYFLFRVKKYISRTSGFVMLAIYIIFVFLELT